MSTHSHHGSYFSPAAPSAGEHETPHPKTVIPSHPDLLTPSQRRLVEIQRRERQGRAEAQARQERDWLEVERSRRVQVDLQSEVGYELAWLVVIVILLAFLVLAAGFVIRGGFSR
jgi:hypothetical protein